MVNPHQQSQYENTYISPGRYQHIGNGTDSFDRGYNCGHGVNQFGYYGDNMVRIEFIIQLGTVETNAAAGLDTLEIGMSLTRGVC